AEAAGGFNSRDLRGCDVSPKLSPSSFVIGISLSRCKVIITILKAFFYLIRESPLFLIWINTLI
ncbi:MAG: hypothetical protein ACLR0I_08370, partial [Streptococcus salivarius]